MEPYDLEKVFADNTQQTKKGTLCLTADKALNYIEFKAPICWTGWLNNHKIVIIQLNSIVGSMNDFEFKEFPERYNHLKKDIKCWIKECLRVLD